MSLAVVALSVAFAQQELAIPVDDPAAPAKVDARDTYEIVSRGTRYVSLANRLDADGVGTAVGLGEEWVVGGDGGTLATRVSARWATQRFVLAAHLPFATYRVPDGRTTGLGNLRIDAFRRWQADSDTVWLFGASVHLPLGRAYTWTNSATGIWPGGGVTAIAQVRKHLGAVDVIGRGALGVHGTAGFDPYPNVYVFASVAGGLDVPVTNAFGLTGEAALSVWDPSPFDASVWARLQPREIEGFRLRAGVLFPLASWVGLSPSDKPAGVREMTLSADLGLSL
ncbi:MAG: hypothetical protein R3F61_16920 [Myxococcota bacterium]